MNWFEKWCGRYWLWAIYAMGLAMLAAYLYGPGYDHAAEAALYAGDTAAAARV
jgi:hypothetical protein